MIKVPKSAISIAALVWVLAFTLILQTEGFAQKGRTLITGSVYDASNLPITDATIQLAKRNNAGHALTAKSDSAGKFMFNTAPGSYAINVSSIGYALYRSSYFKVAEQDTIHLPIVLVALNTTLDAVTIVGKKPFLEQRNDKLVVNVGSSITTAGATGMEILRKVPGVAVVNDRIRLAGKSGVIIMIDGKPSPYTDLEGLLRDMPGGNMDKVEIIANPGAKYEAAGSAGIINIIMKKRNAQGLTGAYSIATGYSSYDQRDVRSDDNHYYRINPSLSLNYSTNKVIAFGTIDYLNRHVFEVNNLDRIIGNNLYKQENYYPYNYDIVNYRTGIEYTLSRKSTIGLLINGNYRNGEGTSKTYTKRFDYTLGSALDSFQTDNLMKINRQNITFNLSYKLLLDTAGQTLSVDADYSDYTYRNHALIDISSNGADVHNDQLGRNPLHYATFKADYTYPFHNTLKLDAGLKFSQVNIDNDLRFTRNGKVDTAQTNRFNYVETVQSAYFNLNQKHKGFEYQVGLRAEHTGTSGEVAASKIVNRKYLQLFPSLLLSQKFGSNWSVHAAYSRRIDRPQFVFLSPFSYFIDSLTYSKGNPALLPQITNTGRLSVNFKGSYFLALSYNHTTNTIYEAAPQQVGAVTYTQANNLGNFKTLVAELNAPFQLTDAIGGNANMQEIYTYYNTGYLSTVYRRKKFSFQGNANIHAKLSRTLTAEANGYYTSRSIHEFNLISAFSGINLGLQKSLFQNKGKVVFSANDIFYKNPTLSTVDYQDIHTRYYYRDESRNFRLTFSYNFGDLQSNRKSHKELGSKEENSRL
jgi:outer membrane receptor protein involved in Fe transport